MVQSPIKLHPRHWRFVGEYLIDLDATHAAIRAGYSKKTAAQIGYQLLQKSSMQQAIAQEQRKAAERVHIDQDRVLREYARIAFADMGQFATWNDETVSLRDSTELPPAQRAAIASVQKSAKGVHIKLHSKVQALDALAKHLGLFRVEENPVGHTLDPAERVARINELLARAGYSGTYDPDGAGAGLQDEPKPH
jgi:phage terminase small subunit